MGNLFEDVYYRMNKKIDVIIPPNIGWLEYKLNDQELTYVWKCIKEAGQKKDAKPTLAGNIDSSWKIDDKNDWFFTHTLIPMIQQYENSFDTTAIIPPIKNQHPYHMDEFWVNYQKKHDFNPPHNHNAIFSFVIWMKIPFDSKDQNEYPKSKNSNSPRAATFEFNYLDIRGKHTGYTYDLNREDEGRMVFFPGDLIHQVFPFYECDEDRISVSGNITMDTTRIKVENNVDT